MADVDRDRLLTGMGATHLHYQLVQGTREECLACNKRHAGADTYRLGELMKHSCFTIDRVGRDFSCPGRVVWHDSTFGFHVDQLVANVGKHNAPLMSKLFMRCHEEVMLSDEHGRSVRHFRDGRWTCLSESVFRAYIAEWLRNFLVKCLTLPAYNASKELRLLYDQLQAGAAVNAVLEETRGLLALAPRRTFDADPYLLGCDNCVVELHPPFTIRPQRVEDYITLSTGYEIPLGEEDDGGLVAAEDIMAKIYPVEEEREYVQRFYGYCLLGASPESAFLALTDRRAGANGKSTIIKFLERALGTYAMAGDKAFLYESKHVESINGHDAGWLAFKHKRLIVFEELAPRALDQSRLKEITGGNAHRDNVRAPHAVTGERLDFVGKIIVSFNESKMPQFDVDDGALLRRMIVVQHRSRFQDPPGDELYSYPRVADVEKSVPPHALLRWLLIGLARYWERGLNQAPDSVDAWRRGLVEEQDDVAQWALERLDYGEGENVNPQGGARRLPHGARSQAGEDQVRSASETLPGDEDAIDGGAEHASKHLHDALLGRRCFAI